MNVSLLLCFLYVFFLPSLVHAVVVVAHFASFLFSADHFVCGITIFITFSLSSTDIGNVFFFLCSFSFSVSCSHFWFCYTFVFLRSPALCATAIGSPEMLQHNVLHSAFCISVWTVCEDVPPCHHNREKFALKCTFEFLFDVRAKRKQQIIKQKKKKLQQ